MTSNTNTLKFILGNRPIFVYSRVSSSSQVGNTHVSMNVQTKSMMDLLSDIGRMRNYKDTIIEVGSAYKMGKLKLRDELIDNMEDGSAIFVYSYDRFSRNVEDFTRIINDLENRDIIIVSYQEPLDYTSASGRSQVIQMVLNGETRSRQLGDRVRTALALKKSMGSFVRAPYGFDLIDVKDKESDITLKRPILNEYEYNVIRFILGIVKGNKTSKQLTRVLYNILPKQQQVPLLFEEKTYERRRGMVRVKEIKRMRGLTYREVSVLLNNYKIHARRDKKWTYSIVRNIYNKYKNNNVDEIKEMHKAEINPLGDAFQNFVILEA
jgi:DNA invertase Pin-like site-specific DNA recombinase